MNQQQHAQEARHVAPEVLLVINDKDEITHLVCCRDRSWEIGFCGAETGHVNLHAEIICSMCIEVVGPKALEQNICPVDDRPCPAGEEFDRLIRERTWG
ncbi:MULTISPECIES: hypothetical protein [Arthrobacter]|uniref:Uncharacterized protein n=2 Tax=Arthrobacter TaxID=1663 RepID=A0ABU9KND0_9MICC|nr:hypothetical protein [Arthrobacter sp. YJM1]MDP5226709.1 hypothetical protein [Arthrobacter sp. YJM1]